VTQQTDRLNTALAGRYRIERHLGEGGMASVYLCEDLKHDRKVALKLLKPELAAVLGADRFVQEIKTTAAMQHPHILPLFDSGTADGFLFYVMPFIDGETLRTKLDRETQLGVDEAVRIAREVADALDYAHQHGIVHRDIKPENILLHGGHALVADFGIALAVSAAAGGRMTETGLSLGTPHYMSPEQATAEKEITGRSDVYSLGSVLYEMLTGNPPHVGSTAQQIIMGIILDVPKPVNEIRRAVPPNVADAVAKAIEKLPADRFESAKGFAEALGNPAFAVAGTAHAPVAAAARAANRRGVVVALGVACAALALVAAWGWMRKPAARRELSARFTIEMPKGIEFDNVYQPLTITHDGRTIIFRAKVNGVVQLVRRSVDDFTVTPIPDTDDGGFPAVSPDDRWLAFVAGGSVRRVPLTGGPSTVLEAGTSAQTLSWATNDILVTSTPSLRAVATSGGAPKLIANADSAIGESIRLPHVLSDGNTILYVSWPGIGMSGARIAVASRSAGKLKVLDVVGTTPLGVADGQLFYVSAGGALMAVPFDRATLTVSGPPRALAEGVNINPSVGGARVALSDSGTLVYVRGGTAMQLVAIATDGTSRVLTEQGEMGGPAWSPDGRQIAVQITSPTGKHDIAICDVATGTLRQITGAGENLNPSWTRDGKQVVYTSTQGSRKAIWKQSVEGSASPEMLMAIGLADVQVALAPDGKSLVFEEASPEIRERKLLYVDLAADRTPRRLATPGETASHPVISPDGKWLAYAANSRATGGQVYVQAFPGPGAATQVSLDGGQRPVWAPDGASLYYLSADQSQLLAAALSPGTAMSVTSRRTVLTGSFFAMGSGNTPQYSASPDGNHFVGLRRASEQTQLVVVTNWLAELRAGARAGAMKQ
jgi:serine/threonine-protein kinase